MKHFIQSGLCAVILTLCAGVFAAAQNSAVRTQFLIESVVLSLTGGVIGILLGLGVSLLIPSLLGWPTSVSTAAVIGSVIFSAAVGIFFGYYPARKAAALDPIDALRYE